MRTSSESARGRPRKPGEPGGDGFSLLEVLIALAVLSISLTAILGAQSGATRSTEVVRFAAIAMPLVRTRMAELELEMAKEGWGEFDDETDGDFSEIGFPRFRWKAVVKKIEMELTAPPATENPMMAMIGQYISVITDAMKESLREVTLTVSETDDGGQTIHEITVTTHFVDTDKVRAPF